MNLGPFPNARVEVSAFEDWPLPEKPVDVIVSASAFHWIDPHVRFANYARQLQPLA